MVKTGVHASVILKGGKATTFATEQPSCTTLFFVYAYTSHQYRGDYVTNTLFELAALPFSTFRDCIVEIPPSQTINRIE